MKKNMLVLALTVTTAFAIGCGREETSEAPAETTTLEQPGMGSPSDVSPIEETKTVSSGQKYLNFTATDTASWAKGDYRAEVWVGDEKVNEQQFNIVDASDAAA